MNAFLNQQKAILRLRKNRQLLSLNKDVLNGSNKYYSGSQNRATILTVNKRGTSFHFPENSSFRFLNPSKQYEYNFHSRSISTNFALYEKSSSKVEDVVKNLKEVEKEKEKSAAATAATETPKTPETTTISTSAPQQQQQVASVATESAVSSQVVKKSLGQKIWAELVHYYHGFRLLFIDINVCRKYLWQILKGEQLSRREHRLLIRTTSDLFRLLPFSVFIIVPFMELLLPLAIKLFPGMLPSTFQSASDRDNKLKQNLKMKIEMAKFLQQTLDDMTVQSKDHRSQSAKEFSEFFKRLRTSGGFATNEEIMKFSKLFEDEITLDSLNRAQLLALCRVLEANTIGTSNLLRFQLRLKIRSLIADDRMIQKEGINSLNYQELQAACRARGMRAYGMTEERLRDQLMEWIDLSLNAKVPPSLLLLSRAMMIPEDVDVSEKLKVTLASLPDTVATQAKAAIGEREGKIDNKTKIEIIKEEQRKIQEEKEEEKEEILAKEQKKLQEKADILVDGAPIVTSDGIVAKTSEQISQMFMEQKAMDQEEKLFVENVKEKELSSEDLKVLEDALDNISKEKKHLIMEKEEIKEIKEEIAEYKEDVEELEQIVTKNKDEQVHVKESRAAKLLYKKVNSMINKLDTVLDDLEKKEKEIKVLIGEPVEITEAEDSAFEEEKKKKEELVRIDEMMSAIRKLQKVSDESVLEKIEQILGRIDDDRDGQLKVEDVMKVIETIGKENVKLSDKQLHEIVDLLDKEEIIETEEKIEKALKKEKVERDAAKAKSEDITESVDKFLLQDKAKELNDPAKNANEVDPKIEQVVKSQSEKILSQIPPAAPSTSSPIKSTSSTQPKDKVI